MKETLLKEKDICDYLKISRTTLWRLKKKGLPSIQVGNSYRYDKNNVINWIASETSEDYIIERKGNISTLDLPDEKIYNNYQINLEYLIQSNISYLRRILNEDDIEKLQKILSKHDDSSFDNQEVVKIFSKEYLAIIKKNYQREARTLFYDSDLNKYVNQQDNKVKIIWGDCLQFLRKMDSESIHLMVTSPPYYNARAYSQWENLNEYLDSMKEIIQESYRVLDNHRIWVFNVGDIFDNDNLTTKSVWGKKRIPLGAYFIKIFEDVGFEFVDDIIWDKGEVESKRHMNNGINYPFYQYPLNCYEHIMIFHKHRLDKTRIPCPVCGSLKVNGNTQSEIGIQSWECKNHKCFVRSPHNRGKRFSLRTNLMQYYHNNDKKNLIEKEIINKWRRDISKFPPVIKITHDKKNRLGHSAPFPAYIPEMAVKYFTFIGEKVLDPFAGSFTTPIVARKLDRIGIGVEINKELFRGAIIKKINDELRFFDNVPYREYEI